MIIGTLAELARDKRDLITENALLRHQQKLGIRVSKRTVQRYIRQARRTLPPRTSAQN
jgi:DNA-binding response OmpR family regulator